MNEEIRRATGKRDIKALMKLQCDPDVKIAFEASSELYSKLKANLDDMAKKENEKAFNIICGDFIKCDDSIPAMLSEGFVISPITHRKYAKCLLNLNKINSVPSVGKCKCDLTTVLMVTGCVCGGE